MNFKAFLLNETPWLTITGDGFEYQGKEVKKIDFRFEDREETHSLMKVGEPFFAKLKNNYLLYNGKALTKTKFKPSNATELPDNWIDYAELRNGNYELLKEPKILRSTDERLIK